MSENRFGEILQILKGNKIVFTIQAWSYLCVGFTVSLLLLSFSYISCHSQIPDVQLFWIYFIHSASFFIGTLLSAYLNRSTDEYRTIFLCTVAVSASLIMLSFIVDRVLVTLIFLVLGLSLGISFSTINVTFVKSFPQQHFALIHLLHLFNALGIVLSAFLFRARTPTDEDCSVSDANKSQFSIGNLHITPIINLNYIFIGIALAQASSNAVFTVIFLKFRTFFTNKLRKTLSSWAGAFKVALMYLLLRNTKEEASGKTSIELHGEQQRSQYEDIDKTITAEEQPTIWDASCMRLVLLSAAIACVAKMLFTLFPFFLFDRRSIMVFEYRIFTCSYALGRMASLFFSDKIAPYFQIGLSIIGCGFACCIFIFDHALVLGAAIFGFSLSQFLPSIIVYVKHSLMLRVDTIYVIVSAYSFGSIVYPLFLFVARDSENRVFVAINFFAMLLLVFLYVSMLNAQAQSERTKASQDSVKIFIDRFFVGETSKHRRTRSLKPLISRLRPMSYKRFSNRSGSPQDAGDVPKIKVTLEKAPQVQYN